MSTNAVIPFDFSAPAAPRARRERSINADIINGGASYPVLHIKGKTFSISKDGERRLLTRTIDDEEVPVASLKLVVVRANHKARVFYGKGYVEGESDGIKPTCFSHDGVRPDASAESPQNASCATCPHAQWGTRILSDGTSGKGTACTVNTRLAVAFPQMPKTVYLMRAPAGSRANFQDAVRAADSHGKDYNEVQMRVSFDPDAATPKLIFKPDALLSDEVYAAVQELYDSQTVRDIIGTPTVATVEEAPLPTLAAPAKTAALPAPRRAVEEDDALPAGVLDVASAPTPALAPAPAPAPTPAKPRARASAPAKPTKSLAEAAPELLGELQTLLHASDD